MHAERQTPTRAGRCETPQNNKPPKIRSFTTTSKFAATSGSGLGWWLADASEMVSGDKPKPEDVPRINEANLQALKNCIKVRARTNGLRTIFFMRIRVGVAAMCDNDAKLLSTSFA